MFENRCTSTVRASGNEVLSAAKSFQTQRCEHATSDASLFSATGLMRMLSH
jgi:hypothetical protein